MLSRREKVQEEVISSEQKYVDNLNILINAFVTP
jgi:hypothetical protein